MIPAAILGGDRRWRLRTDWRGRLILQLLDQQRIATSPLTSETTVTSVWRDARVEDLAEWGGAP